MPATRFLSLSERTSPKSCIIVYSVLILNLFEPYFDHAPHAMPHPGILHVAFEATEVLSEAAEEDPLDPGSSAEVSLDPVPVSAWHLQDACSC